MMPSLVKSNTAARQCSLEKEKKVSKFPLGSRISFAFNDVCTTTFKPLHHVLLKLFLIWSYCGLSCCRNMNDVVIYKAFLIAKKSCLILSLAKLHSNNQEMSILRNKP